MKKSQILSELGLLVITEQESRLQLRVDPGAIVLDLESDRRRPWRAVGGIALPAVSHCHAENNRSKRLYELASIPARRQRKEMREPTSLDLFGS